MLRRASTALFCALALVTPAYGQEIFVPRELKAIPVHPPKPKEVVRRAEPVTDADLKPVKESASSNESAKPKAPKSDTGTVKTAKAAPTKEKSEKPAAPKEKPAVAKMPPAENNVATIKVEKSAPVKDSSTNKTVAKTEPAKEKKDIPAPAKEKADSDLPTIKVEKATVAKEPATKTVAKTETAKPEVTVAKTEKPSPTKEKPVPATKPPTTKSEAFVAKVEPAPPREGPVKLPMKSEQVSVPSQKEPPQIIPTGSLDTGFTKIADGFDFPVGKPEAEGYYKARGFRPGGHVGEDWDGVRGGDTDLRDPIYSIGDGIVVFARDVHLGWGNVVIVRHAYRENGNVRYVDSLYGHLNSMLVSRGQRVTRGQQIATMGTAHGQYDAHLHFEIRKNLEIGMSRSKFQKDFSNYYDPTQFINSHRRLAGGGANYKVAMNTFTHDWTYHFDRNRDFGPRKRSTGESSAALRRAVTSR